MSYQQLTSLSNLATHTIIIPTTDTYTFQGTLTLPNLEPSATQGPGGGAGTGVGGGPTVDSQVLVTIRQNGTQVYLGHPGDRGFLLQALQCTAGDVITIQRSSSLAQDQQINSIRMTLMVSEGSR